MEADPKREADRGRRQSGQVPALAHWGGPPQGAPHQGGADHRTIDRRRLVQLLGGAFAGSVTSGLVAAQPTAGLPRLALADPDNSVEDLTNAGLAQRPIVPRADLDAPAWRTFFEELDGLGWIEGETIIVDRWSATGITDIERRAAIIRDIAASEPDVIVTHGDYWTPQLTAAIRTIPIVALVADPVDLGIVADVARPEGNVTGAATRPGGQSAFAAKLMDLLVQIAPATRRIAWPGPERGMGPGGPDAPANAAAVAALAARGIEVVIIASDPPSFALPDIETWQRQLVARIVAEGCNGVHFQIFPEFYFGDLGRFDFWPGLLLDAGLPSVTNAVAFVRASPGGLIQYGASTTPLYAVAAQYVDRLLRGAAIADLPFYMAVDWNTRINLRTARALGLNIPVEILTLATEIIE